jgi:hypothetical protein
MTSTAALVPTPRASGLLIALTAANVIGLFVYGFVWLFAAAAVGGQPQAGWQGVVLDVLVLCIGASFFAPICAWTIRPHYPITALVVAAVPALPVILVLALEVLPIVLAPVFILMNLSPHASLPRPQPPHALYRPAIVAPAGPAYDGLNQGRRSGLCRPIPQGLPEAVLKTETRMKAHLCGQPRSIGDDPNRFVGAVGQRP